MARDWVIGELLYCRGNTGLREVEGGEEGRHGACSDILSIQSILILKGNVRMNVDNGLANDTIIETKVSEGHKAFARRLFVVFVLDN